MLLTSWTTSEGNGGGASMAHMLFEQNHLEANPPPLMTFRLWQANGSVQDFSVGVFLVILGALEELPEGVEGLRRASEAKNGGCNTNFILVIFGAVSGMATGGGREAGGRRAYSMETKYKLVLARNKRTQLHRQDGDGYM
ncbi:hypothetical protein BDN71DRAFT_1432599 [Pleurotus eryngii]|uniref:Uncharacterized protein n=1 Tax=Pleurotus eryngii TaxID=5323 RepID=A0A9P5ZVS9_PLEER|nr:hypothetical protein BDN71DRAFT_1432599 [Pleurotus eryngii]